MNESSAPKSTSNETGREPSPYRSILGRTSREDGERDEGLGWVHGCVFPLPLLRWMIWPVWLHVLTSLTTVDTRQWIAPSERNEGRLPRKSRTHNPKMLHPVSLLNERSDQKLGFQIIHNNLTTKRCQIASLQSSRAQQGYRSANAEFSDTGRAEYWNFNIKVNFLWIVVQMIQYNTTPF